MDEVLKCRASDLLDLSVEVLQSGASLRFQARGNSMRPLICDGDQLEVAPCEIDDLAIGDVILYPTRQSGIRAHRLVRLTLDGSADPVLVTRGDARNGQGELIRSEQVLGRIVRVTGQDGTTWVPDRGAYRLAGQLMARYPILFRSLRFLPIGVRCWLLDVVRRPVEDPSVQDKG